MNEALEHAEPLYDFARYLTGSATEADDLLQETYARAVSAIDRFERGSNMKAWLFRILRNAFFDLRRREKNRGPHFELSDDVTVEAELLRGDIEIDRLKNAVAEDIERALLGISEEARTAILLDLEGFSEKEIADVMNCAQGTVKSRLARARASLRAALAEYAR